MMKYVVGTIASLCVIACIAAIVLIVRSEEEIEDLFAAYSTEAGRHTTAAYVPGVDENPVRQALGDVLAQVLVSDISDGERLALAREGLDLLDVAERQIDDIGEAGERVDAAIASIESEAGEVGNFYVRDDLQELAGLARERSRVIADIRALSYRANFHMTQIFRRIIADDGALTPSHVAELNQDIPVVEAQFDERSNLYLELEDMSSEIRDALKSAGY